jgi:integrase
LPRIVLTDKFCKSAPWAPQGERRTYKDALVPGLGLRVTDTGHKSWVLSGRYPLHPENSTRRTLAEYGVLTLAEAREKARVWLALIQRGIDPRVELERERAEQRRRQANSFAHVAREFLRRHVKGDAQCELEEQAAALRREQPKTPPAAALRAVRADPKNSSLVQRARREGIVKKDEADRIINREFVRRWGARPITDILPEECAAAILAIVKRGAPYEAHNAFGHLRRLFNWAIGAVEFGLTTSPVAALRPSDLIGKRDARDRVLADAELRAVWDACGGDWRAEALAEVRRRDRPQDPLRRLAYPYGPVVRLLILTGQRLHEVSDMRWSEIDFDRALWTIPADRMKGGRTHEVPLAPMALELVRPLPRFTVGDYVFTTTDGQKPVNGFSSTKGRLDRLVGAMPPWVLHDLRRTMRTHLSALPIEDRVREQMVAHAQPGLHKVYDRHSYQDEKRRGFELWERRLAGILNPAPGGVADIAAERDRRRTAGA